MHFKKQRLEKAHVKFEENTIIVYEQIRITHREN